MDILDKLNKALGDYPIINEPPDELIREAAAKIRELESKYLRTEQLLAPYRIRVDQLEAAERAKCCSKGCMESCTNYQGAIADVAFAEGLVTYMNEKLERAGKKLDIYSYAMHTLEEDHEGFVRSVNSRIKAVDNDT